ncbi:MAG: ubiquinone/menaquinone biosynthesis methyltransferase [Chloroflexi bacterium]|nr:ubiquinone/menaquinone biosynthesis methyltransferase [Chloroflexota bacterium]
MPSADHDTRIAAMFDRISPRYDRLNRVLSFGADIAWRGRAIALLGARPGDVVLDLGAGTGDLSRAVAARGARVLAIDLSPRMLGILARKGAREIHAIVATGRALPLADASVDRVVSGFTVRNVGELAPVFGELRRVLRPGGRVVLLELSHPPSPLFASLYSFYFDRLAPLLATLLGGDAEAYRYLPRSLRAFPGPEDLAGTLGAAGFTHVRFERLTFGIAAIHMGERRA